MEVSWAADAWMNRPAADWDEDAPDFPEMDGPVFLIGACALVDAVWAAVGEDPLTDVCGVLVPALDAAVPGRRPDLYPHPDRFDLARWLTPSRDHRASYLPFGAGPTRCIGEEFGLAEATLILATTAAR